MNSRSDFVGLFVCLMKELLYILIILMLHDYMHLSKFTELYTKRGK